MLRNTNDGRQRVHENKGTFCPSLMRRSIRTDPRVILSLIAAMSVAAFVMWLFG